MQESFCHIKEGSDITGVKVIAGKGAKRNIDDINRLTDDYKLSNGQETNKADWQKMRGTAIIVYRDRERKGEVHWYQCNNIGKVEWKLKRWLDEG